MTDAPGAVEPLEETASKQETADKKTNKPLSSADEARFLAAVVPSSHDKPVLHQDWNIVDVSGRR